MMVETSRSALPATRPTARHYNRENNNSNENVLGDRSSSVDDSKSKGAKNEDECVVDDIELGMRASPPSSPPVSRSPSRSPAAPTAARRGTSAESKFVLPPRPTGGASNTNNSPRAVDSDWVANNNNNNNNNNTTTMKKGQQQAVQHPVSPGSSHASMSGVSIRSSQHPPRPTPALETTTSAAEVSSMSSTGRTRMGAKPRLPRPQEVKPSSPSVSSPKKGGTVSKRMDTVEMEQALFEQRLCEDAHGIAVRKINQFGKSNLRYVRCVVMSDDKSTRSISSRSAGSWARRSLQKQAAKQQQLQQQQQETITPRRPSLSAEKTRRALAWGRKKDVMIPLERFIAVRKGKTTERAKRNPSPAYRVLSLLTDDPSHPSLDIETPTRMDRDKFARAFARFLEVPLESPDDMHSVHSAEVQGKVAASTEDKRWSASISAPGDVPSEKVPAKSTTVPNTAVVKTMLTKTSSEEVLPEPEKEALAADDANDSDENLFPDENNMEDGLTNIANESKTSPNIPTNLALGKSSDPARTKDETKKDETKLSADNVVSRVPPEGKADERGEEHLTEVSSLTGHGYDQELVEELHNALNELRAELEESRAEAARAVKVAEQAIQSAEKSNSAEWQNTVTHKAAEAAAQAQRRSAEAMAKQRLAEERLEGERRTASFWRKQAEIAEEEAGKLQTRAAAAEVQRALIEEQFESERRLAAARFDSIQNRYLSSNTHQRDALEEALERNRALELELSAARRDLESKMISEDSVGTGDQSPINGRKMIKYVRKKNQSQVDETESRRLLTGDKSSSSSTIPPVEGREPTSEGVPSEQLLKLQAESTLIRQQFELLRRATTDELQKLPLESQEWATQVADALRTSRAEVSWLQQRLASEGASRRKLLHEVQDLRGNARVYCRPKPSNSEIPSSARFLSIPSQETLLLYREDTEGIDDSSPLCFEFDRVFPSEANQHDVYTELEETCLGVLDGYNICIMAYGQCGSGKTYTLLGDVATSTKSAAIENYGIHFKAMKQLFSIAEHRSDRYKDVFSLSLLEVDNERLCDLLAGTSVGESRGQVIRAETKTSRRGKGQKQGDDDGSSAKGRLEIKTDIHGNTVVQGLLSVELKSFEDLLDIWRECIETRRTRLEEQEIDSVEYGTRSHVIATVKAVSSNIVTGLGSVGRLEFVDLAASDLSAKAFNDQTSEHVLKTSAVGGDELRFVNRSIETLSEVVDARARFVRSVPYRNSTLTHLLRDSLESDTKLVLIACISSDSDDFRQTVSSLQFATRMRRVSVGRATKHALTPP